jgi:hypothetical protein
MTEQVLPLRAEDYYDLLSFLVSSAFLLCHGEHDEEFYPSLRLMDGASRLTKAIIAGGGLEDEGWAHAFVAKCEAGLNLLMTDPEAFVEFVDESTRMLAKEMKRRAESH